MEENSFVAHRKSPRMSIVLGVIAIVVLVLLYSWYQIGKPFSGPQFGPVQEIVVEEGMGQQEIAELLAENEIIDSAFFFRVYAVLSGAGSDLQAGEYKIGKGEGIRQSVYMLTRGLSLHEASYSGQRGSMPMRQRLRRLRQPHKEPVKQESKHESKNKTNNGF